MEKGGRNMKDSGGGKKRPLRDRRSIIDKGVGEGKKSLGPLW